MRLYQIITITTPSADEEVLKPTDETYPSIRAFKKHAELNGEKYVGKRWMLLSGSGKEITIESKPQYKISFSKTEQGTVKLDKD